MVSYKSPISYYRCNSNSRILWVIYKHFTMLSECIGSGCCAPTLCSLTDSPMVDSLILSSSPVNRWQSIRLPECLRCSIRKHSFSIRKPVPDVTGRQYRLVLTRMKQIYNESIYFNDNYCFCVTETITRPYMTFKFHMPKKWCYCSSVTIYRCKCNEQDWFE